MKSSGASTGNFFQIDKRIWPVVCGIGLNAAVAFLVLARFSQGNNATTLASIHAIETHTGISRGRAKEGLQSLLKYSVIRQERGGLRPRYTILPAHEVPGTGVKLRTPISKAQQAIYDIVNSGGQPDDSSKKHAQALARNGWLIQDHDGSFSVNNEKDGAADWIWLPNELVTGAAKETPPLELVRQTQDVMTLRLMVDLYDVQNLRDDGGVSKKHMYKEYDRFEVGQQGQFAVWGFKKKGRFWIYWTDITNCHYRSDLTEQEKNADNNEGIDFFRRIESLSDLGLIEWMPYLFESDSEDAEPIHPYGDYKDDTIEGRLAVSADRAGAALLTNSQLEWAREKGLYLAPVPQHIANVRMIGIARLRYRPKTKLTAAWFADQEFKGDGYIQKYEEIYASRKANSLNKTNSLQHQGVSRGYQG